jgi:hypothetical protein
MWCSAVDKLIISDAMQLVEKFNEGEDFNPCGLCSLLNKFRNCQWGINDMQHLDMIDAFRPRLFSIYAAGRALLAHQRRISV